jgi:acyl dehydratase
MAVKQGWEGRYFEDFEVGDLSLPPGRTVTEADNIRFTLLTNTNQISTTSTAIVNSANA